MNEKKKMETGQYRKLGMMVGVSFVAMYGLMYAMVNSSANVYSNLNEVYMAGLMAAPMMAIELLVMGAMYKNRTLNAVLLLASLLASALFFTCIRRQAAISDGQFLRSMIPHHASAILMCENASIRDPAIAELCRNIISSQQREIDRMRSLLSR